MAVSIIQKKRQHLGNVKGVKEKQNNLEKLQSNSQGVSVFQHTMLTVLCYCESQHKVLCTNHGHSVNFNCISCCDMPLERDVVLTETFSFTVAFPIYSESKQIVGKQSLQNGWSRLLYGSSQLKGKNEKKNRVAAMPLQDTAEMEAGLGITPFPVGMHWQWVLCREGWV